MTDYEFPRICGGTFFTQLLLSKKPTATKREHAKGETDVIHNEDILFALLKLVKSDAQKPAGGTFETYTSNFKKCGGAIGEDLKFDNKAVVDNFKKRLANDRLEMVREMDVFCREYIDVSETSQNHVLLVKRLFELIRDDEDVEFDTDWSVDIDDLRKKEELPSVAEVCLPTFLLDVWTFVVTKRNDNRIGAKTIKAWSDPKCKDRYKGNDGSSIGDITVTLLDDALRRKEQSFAEDKPHDETSNYDEADFKYDDPYIKEKTVEPSRYTVNQFIQKIDVVRENSTVIGFIGQMHVN